MLRIRDLKGIWRPRIKPTGLGRRRALVFGLRHNQTGGARTLAHLQEGPTAKERVPERGKSEAAEFIPGCRVTTAGLVYGGVAQGQGQPSGTEGGEQQQDCFHSTSENSMCGDAECASCGGVFLVHSLTPY